MLGVDDHLPVVDLRVAHHLVDVVDLAHAHVAFTSSRNHSSRHGDGMIFSISRARPAPRGSRRARTDPAARERSKSGRPMARQKFAQSHGSVQPMVSSLSSRVS